VHKFKSGDKVKEYHYDNCYLTVINTFTDDGEYVCNVISTNGIKYKVKERLLYFDHSDLPKTTREVRNLLERCPKCGGEWRLTSFGVTKYYDCTSCKTKAEDVCN
jgi:tRNA(Ile2) C34 agmatinyltransferase TiaS